MDVIDLDHKMANMVKAIFIATQQHRRLDSVQVQNSENKKRIQKLQKSALENNLN